MIQSGIREYLKEIHQSFSKGDALEDIQHYIKIAKALQLTIEYQTKIDKLYPKIENNLIKSNNKI